MSDLNLEFDTEHKKINLDSDNSSGNVNIKTDDSNAMLGVELLINEKKSGGSKPDLNVATDISGGYSSGEDNVKKSIKEDLNFFNEDKPSTPLSFSDNHKTEETKSVPIQEDPIINNTRGEESGEFRPIHSMSSQDIKNEKIDLIYKFKKLESQGIRTTMNYNMNSHLEDMRNEYIKLKKQREIETMASMDFHLGVGWTTCANNCFFSIF